VPILGEVARERCECKVQPVLSRDFAPEEFTPEDILAHERDQSRMLGGMVQSVAGPDALHKEPSGLGDHLGVARFATAEGSRVARSQPIAERVGQHFGRIEHDLLTACVPARLAQGGRSPTSPISNLTVMILFRAST
jgi:hypothetical protein